MSDLRRQVYIAEWGAIISGLLVLGSIAFVLWKIIEALPKFIKAWQ